MLLAEMTNNQVMVVSILSALVTGVLVGLPPLILAWAKYQVITAGLTQAQALAKTTAEKVDTAIANVAAVDAKVNGIIPKLVAAGKIEATQEERDRAAAVLAAEVATEAEIVRRVEEAKSEEIVKTTNGQVHSAVAGNVETIKRDVKKVGRDVETVKAEVTREVSEGVKQGISEAKKAQ